MTRVTNFGIKRTYVQAGFSHDAEGDLGDPLVEAAAVKEVAQPVVTDEQQSQAENGGEVQPKKRRKRDRRRKPKKVAEDVEATKGDDKVGEIDADVKMDNEARPSVENRKGKEKAAGRDNKARRKETSERRRLKRIEDKSAETTCFVCREKGHRAKECPNAKAVNETESGETVVGICYRCGSKRHNLSRCKKPVDEFNPLPFASCFVCHKKGHLVSACPQNKEKGVYPNGGSCKLCGETSHLAKDCGLRKQDSVKNSMVLGTGKDAGADEDDFHSLNRKTHAVDREEQREEKRKQKLDVKAGVSSGVVKAFGKEAQAPAKKVVYF
ncbi:hypothetical protein AX17_004254 [Amanita inopinata Kibby_2008]|nr:hypothetical protein AX17_004254 [Amanita inopinata Kibby_2008]